MTKIKKFNKIIYHHTATADLPLDKMVLSMKRKRGRVPAHYVVGADGGFKKIEENVGMNVGATSNAKANLESIQIETIGNFNKRRPTLKQYQTLGQLTERIEQKYGKLKHSVHRDESASACPGRYFDINMVRKKLYTFEISRYYSPKIEQEVYLSQIPGYYSIEYKTKFRRYDFGYEQEVCMNCGCQLDPTKTKQLYDCSIPADGKELLGKDIGKVAACPKTIKLGTKIYLENYGIVTCRDRGGAITDDGKTIRLDIRMGYGNSAVKDIRKNKYAGIKHGYFIH